MSSPWLRMSADLDSPQFSEPGLLGWFLIEYRTINKGSERRDKGNARLCYPAASTQFRAFYIIPASIVVQPDGAPKLCTPQIDREVGLEFPGSVVSDVCHQCHQCLYSLLPLLCPATT